MSPGSRFNLAIQETRLMAMTAQILFGFQFHAVFQSGFALLSAAGQRLDVAAELLMVASLGLMAAPSTQHHLVEHGGVSPRLERATTRFAALALMPFAAGIGIDLFLVVGAVANPLAARTTGGAFFALALTAWFAPALLHRPDSPMSGPMSGTEQQSSAVPTSTRIRQLLTEARVVLPGVQALFGFQLVAVMMPAFEKLPPPWKYLHLAALAMVTLSIILLVSLTAVHRLAFAGAESDRFVAIGTRLLLAAMIPLALGIAGDVAVAVAKVTGSPPWSAGLGVLAWLILAGLWFAQPLLLRRRLAHAGI